MKFLRSLGLLAVTVGLATAGRAAARPTVTAKRPRLLRNFIAPSSN